MLQMLQMLSLKKMQYSVHLLGTAAEAATYQANAVEGTPDSPATLRFGITAAASAYSNIQF